MTLMDMIEMLPPIPRAIWRARIRAMIIQHAVDRGHLDPAGKAWKR